MDLKETISIPIGSRRHSGLSTEYPFLCERYSGGRHYADEKYLQLRLMSIRKRFTREFYI